MGESLYGYDNYGEGLYSRSPYVRGAAAIDTSFALTAIPQRIKDGVGPAITAFSVSEASERVRDGGAVLEAVFTVLGTPEAVFNVSVNVTTAFGVHASAAYTADGKATIALEYPIVANGEGGRFWVDNTYPSDWSDTTTPDTIWKDTTAEQWNG